MIDFFGNPLFHNLSDDGSGTMDMTDVLKIAPDRIQLIADEIVEKWVDYTGGCTCPSCLAKKPHGKNPAQKDARHNKDSKTLGNYLESLNLELLSPEECFFTGMSIGKLVGKHEAEMQHKLEQMLADPKVMAEMFMDIMRKR